MNKTTDPAIDIVVGISDGLIIPFAIATAASRVAANNDIIVLVTIAATIVGALAMAFGSYYAAKHDHEHNEEREKELYDKLGLDQDVVQAISEESLQNKEHWQELTAKHGSLPAFDAAATKASARNIGIAYTIGGVLPALPYMLIDTVPHAFKVSVGVTVACLFLLGFLKAKYTGQNVWGGAFRYILTGGTAALAAYFVAGLFV